MASVRKKDLFSKSDTVEKNLILEAFWKKCIEKPDQEGIDYLKSQLKKYMITRPSISHSSIESNINRINSAMTCEAFKDALRWITPLEAKLIDLFENLKVIDQIERKELKDKTVELKEDELQTIKDHLDEMKMSVSMTVGNVRDEKTSSVHSENIPVPTSPFAIHSVTKIFTGVLALKIIPEDMLFLPIKNIINKEAWNLLPVNVKNHLEEHKVTLRQVMIHEGGLGDCAYSNNYRLCLLSDETKPEPGNLYLKKEGHLLKYTVRNFLNNVVSAEINADELKKISTLKEPFDLNELQPLLTDILHITAKKGDTRRGYREVLENKDGPPPVISHVKDFLQYAEYKTYPVGVEHYSNLGITLVGLAIEEAYRRTHLEAPLEFDEILYEHILKPAGIKRSDFSKENPGNGRVNETDPVASKWIGGPAGGYWATPETLEKFGRWLYKECTTKPEFMALVSKYGKEFYKKDRNVIEHSGTFESSSAFFYLSLTSGNMLNILSDQQLIAPILMSTIKRNIFCSPIEELERVVESEVQINRVESKSLTSTAIVAGKMHIDSSSLKTAAPVGIEEEKKKVKIEKDHVVHKSREAPMAETTQPRIKKGM